MTDATATHCPYCALQCGMFLSGSSSSLSVVGNDRFPVNKGGLCLKGWTATETLAHRERLRSPLVRHTDGDLVEASWDQALDLIVTRTREIQHAHGREAVGVFGGGSLTNEKAYLLGKFARVALGTPNIDYNGRFCMSSAAAAGQRAFGIDRGLPFPVADIAQASVILLVGANPAETMPPLMSYFEAQLSRGGKLIVVDPRKSATAQWATHHLAVRPGTDAALANGILHVLVRDGRIDLRYIAARTDNFDEVRRSVAGYWPERVERITGVPQSAIEETARLLGAAERPMILTARGPEQQSQGVSNALAYINIALALGAVGRPGAGFGTLTGQGNGQGGREHGQKADQLPGYRRIDDPAARAHLASVWNIPESSLPGVGKSAFELLNSLGQPGGVRQLFVVGSNVVVSAPDALRVEQRLRSLDFLVVHDFFLSETAALADVVLPAAQWAEEEGTMTNLEGRVLRRRQAVEPPSGVRSDLDVLTDLARRLGAKASFTANGSREVFDEFRRATKGGVADYSGMTYERLDAEDGLFWPCPDTCGAANRPTIHPGTPRLFAETFPTANGRAKFHPIAHQPPAEDRDGAFPLYLTTGRVLAQYQSGNQTRRVAKLTDVLPTPLAEMHPVAARLNGLSAGDRVQLATRRGTSTFTLKLTPSIREDTVFVPFHWAGEQSANRLTNPALDPISRMPEFKVCAVSAKRVEGDGD